MTLHTIHYPISTNKINLQLSIIMSDIIPSKRWTIEEIAALSQFKKQLEDLDLSNPLLEDRRLINWLRARELRLPDAEAMLRKHLKWRQEAKIDTILTSSIIPAEEPAFKSIPVEVFGHDKQGNTIFIVYCGSLDPKKLVQTFGRETSMNVIYYLLENAYADIANHSTDPDLFKRVTYICDMDGFRFKDFMSSEILDILILSLKIVEANYPELLHTAAVINAPFIFPILWNILKPFLSETTLSKVNIIGQNQDKIEKYLKEIIEVDQLPRKFGGTGFSKKIPGLNASSSSSRKVKMSDLNLLETVIPAGESFELNYEVETPKALLSWAFKTKSHDIGFSLIYKPFLITNNQNESCTGKERIEYKRFNTQKSVQSGSLVCEAAGQYTLRFDNTYSRFREKVLLYQIEMTQLTINGNVENENSQDSNK